MVTGSWLMVHGPCFMAHGQERSAALVLVQGPPHASSLTICHEAGARRQEPRFKSQTPRAKSHES